MSTPHLFSPLRLRSLELRNRIAVSPMCQYSCAGDGIATAWHMVHLGSRAVGGAGRVRSEATAVEERGRISPADLGIWTDEQAARLAPVAAFIRANGAAPGIQLAHAGRKASTAPPGDGGGPLAPDRGAWQVIGPSPIPFAEGYPVPEAMGDDDIEAVIAAFAAAARRALAAAFEVVEVHAAHGYLLHEFLSPLSNRRGDAWGDGFEGRTRLLLEVVRAVRRVWPTELPLLVRISASDWTEGGWGIEDSVRLAARLGPLGVDLVDCSSGGAVPATIPVGPGYQVPFAEAVRHRGGVASGAVGLITEPTQADAVIREGKADLVLLARAMLRDPYWALRAAHELGIDATWPVQYLRGRW